MDFDIDFDDLFNNAVLSAALATVHDETGQGNLDRKKLWTTALPGSEYVKSIDAHPCSGDWRVSLASQLPSL